MAMVPGLAKVLAMVDGDAVKPGADRGLAAKLIQPKKGLQEDVVGGVLGFLRVGEETQGKVINGPAVLLIEAGKLRRRPAGRHPPLDLRRCRGFVHECFHLRLDRVPGKMSRRMRKTACTGRGADFRVSAK